MANPFVYPKVRHVRTITPPKLSSYRRYKKYLRQEFRGQCVYCRMPDSIMGVSQFGADHYKPQSRYPNLSTEYENLYYCCNGCNSNKGDAPPIGMPPDIFVPNPCDHVMYAHMRYKRAEVEHITKAGQYTVELLDLNEETLVARREDNLHMIDVLEISMSELAAAKKNLNRKKKTGEITESDFSAALKKIVAFQEKSQRALDRCVGNFI